MQRDERWNNWNFMGKCKQKTKHWGLHCYIKNIDISPVFMFTPVTCLSGGFLVAALPGIPSSFHISSVFYGICLLYRCQKSFDDFCFINIVSHNFASVNDQQHCGTTRYIYCLIQQCYHWQFLCFLFGFKLFGVFCVVVNCYFWMCHKFVIVCASQMPFLKLFIIS